MKINIFYILSKSLLLLLMLFSIIISFSLIISNNQNILLNILIIILSLTSFYIILNLKKNRRIIRLFFIIILIPISSYLSLNLLSSIDYKNIFSVNSDINESINYTIEILYYFIPSLLLMLAYKYEFLSTDLKITKIRMPEIVTFIFQVVIFIIPLLIVLSRVFNLELTSILATSGILAAVIGFALQANLSNMLSGIFVNLERPFNQDDWITIENYEGKVIDVNWRATKLRTWDNREITLPNEMVANATIENWSKNDTELSKGYRIIIDVHFHVLHDPKNIQNLINNALQKVKPVDGRASLDFMWVKFVDVDELGLKFLISFDCIDRMKNNAQKDAVMMQVHNTLSHSGITMSAGRMYTKLNSDAGLTALNTVRKVDDFEPVKTSKFNPYNESIKNRVLLSRIPIFMSLNDEEIENLSNKCVRKTYEKDDYIIKQDDPGDSLFVIADGICGVYVNTPDKKMISVAKLSTTDFFGEFSLMTGEKRSASVIAESPTVALVVEKERMKSVMKNNSEMYDYVSNVLAKRKLELNKTISKENNKNTNVKNIASELKKLILNFLS